MEVPIWNPDGSLNEKFAELDFANATYINGAIVMTMKNGCEGNLVIIPVQRDKYTPAPVRQATPRRQTSEPETPVVETPEDPDGPRTRVSEECINRRVHIVTWIMKPGTNYWTKLSSVRTPERCG